MPSWPDGTIAEGMPGRPITTVATHTARSIRRRLAAAAARERRGHAPRVVALTVERRDDIAPPPDYRADDARLDALRGELVHELDRLAAADSGSSAGFRRI